MSDSAQKKMQGLLDSLVQTGPELGLQLCAYHHGVRVVDVCAGVADSATRRPVTPDTLFPVFSVTKGVAATLLHILVERGLIGYDTPIASVWPEFGAHGKGGITLRHAMSHQAGLPLLPAGLTPAQVCDWKTLAAAIADAKPVTAPGQIMTYHAITFGSILGEVACRVTGKSFPQLLTQEVTGPLGLSDFFVGIPDRVESRIATVYDAPAAPAEEPPPDPAEPRDILPWMRPLGTFLTRPDVRRACLPAANGIMNARDLASFYAALVPGGRNGRELLPPARVRTAVEQQALQWLPELPVPRRMGLGYFLGGEGCPELSSRPDAFGHGGYGGAVGYADPSCGLAVGLTKNYLSISFAAPPVEPLRLTVLRQLRSALGLSE
jgi:CubicO group peptidase (beta-lactamase class C family)